MNNKKEMYDNGSDKKAAGNGAIPGFLGNEGKCKEVSSVFATILDRGYDKRNEVQRTVPYNWMGIVVQSRPVGISQQIDKSQNQIITKTYDYEKTTNTFCITGTFVPDAYDGKG